MREGLLRLLYKPFSFFRLLDPDCKHLLEVVLRGGVRRGQRDGGPVNKTSITGQTIVVGVYRG